MRNPLSILLFWALWTCMLALPSQILFPDREVIGEDSHELYSYDALDESFSGDLFSMIPVHALSDDVLTETQLLANRLCNRTIRLHRVAAQQFLSLLKILAREISLYDAFQTHQLSQLYTTARCQSWNTPSEHYVFGMRRLLI